MSIKRRGPVVPYLGRADWYQTTRCGVTRMVFNLPSPLRMVVPLHQGKSPSKGALQTKLFPSYVWPLPVAEAEPAECEAIPGFPR